MQHETEKPVRVTADLPASEFDLLKAARKANAGSTTDVMRALLRLQAQDQDLAETLAEEIAQMRLEKAQAQLDAKRAARRARLKTKGAVAAA